MACRTHILAMRPSPAHPRSAGKSWIFGALALSRELTAFDAAEFESGSAVVILSDGACVARGCRA